MRGFVLIMALTRLGHAFVLDGRFPSETDIARIYDEPEKPAITAPPSVEELLRRAEVATVLLASDNICGYFNGSSASPYSCINSAETCAIFTTAGGGVPACCASKGCYFATTCVDSASLCTRKCLTETATLKCTGTKLPYCGTVTFDSGVSDYYCVANNHSTVQQAQTTYNGQIGGGFAPIAITLSDSSSPWPAFSSSPTTSSRTTSAGPAITVASNNVGDSGPAAPIGAIVGGAIGGVALLAAIGFGMWYVRKQNHTKPEITAAGATSGSAAGDAADQGNPGPFGQSPQPMAAVPVQHSPYYPVAASPIHTGSNGVPYYHQEQDKPVGFVSVSPNTTGVALDRDMNMSPMSVATELDSNPATMVHEMPSTPATKTQPHELA